MKKRGIKGITTTITVVIAVVTLLVGLLIGMLLQAQLGVFAPVAPGLTGDVEVGVLLPATGDLATYGANAKSAVTLAATEVNEFLEDAGAGWTLKLVHEDSATDPVVSLEKTESLFARGIEFIIGPQASDSVASIKDYCDSNEILVISPSSTRIGLNKPDDYLFRFCPSDLIQGPAIARLMADDGVTKVIAVYRDDAWGKGLHDATQDRFEQPAIGGEFIESIGYDPDAPGFGTIAATLDTEVADAISTYGADKVGVLYIAFEEVVQFFTECAVYSSDGWGANWYGSDGTTGSQDMIDDTTTAIFSYQTGFINPIFSPTVSDKWQRIHDHVKADLGRRPDSYAYVAYDIVWVLALSLLEVDAYDSEAVKAALPTVTQNYFGASGWIELDEVGDRKAGDYDIWEIVEVSPGTYDWEVVGKYVSYTDSVFWSPSTFPSVYVFEPVWNNKIFYVVAETNSTVSNFSFSQSEREIGFNVTGPDGTIGFCNMAIPKRLLYGSFSILVDGEPVAFKLTFSAAHTNLSFEYTHSAHIVRIVGTSVQSLTYPLKVGILQEIRSLSPFTALTDMDYVAYSSIYECLTTIDEDLNVEKNLAESWEAGRSTYPNGTLMAKGTKWIFHLVKNATFHDGQPVTSEDVKFSLEYNLDIAVWAFDMYFNQDATGDNAVQQFENGTYRLETPDPYTFVIHLKYPCAFVDHWFIPVVPKHIWEDVPPIQAQQVYDPVKEGTVIGSGPFKFVEKTAEYVRLTANDDYHWGRPHVDEIYWVYYYSEETMVSALKKGEIDAIGYGLSPQEYISLLDENIPYLDFAAVPKATGFWMDVVLNMNEGGNSGTGDKRLAHDRNLRKALNYATDREFIVNDVYLGLADIGYGPITPAVDHLGWYWEPRPEYFSGIGSLPEEYTYDPDKAIEYLEREGEYGPYLDRDGDGIREDKNGRPLSFEVLVRKEFPVDHTIFLYLKEWWKEVGVEITEELVDEQTMEYRTYYPPSGPRFDMAIWYWSQDIDPNYMLAVDTTWQGGWWSECWYHNETYDEYYRLQFGEMNRTQRQRYVWKCQEIWYDDSPRILYAYPWGLYAWRTDKFGGWGNMNLHLGRIPEYFWNRQPLYTELKPVRKTVSVDATPNQNITNTLWFKNSGDTAFTGKANVSGSFVRDWASPPTLEFGTVGPGENKTLEFTVEIPDDAPSGSCILSWNLYADGKYMDTVNFVFEIPAPPIWTQIWFWAAIIGIVAVATALILYRKRIGTKSSGN